MTISEVAETVSKGAGKGFLFYLKITTFTLFFIYILIHAISLGIKEKDAGIVFTELGREFFSPLQSASENIQKFNTDGIFNSIWSYWGIFFELYKIYLWFVIILWIVDLFLGMNPIIVRLPVVLLIFYTINIVYSAVILHDFNLPFIATKNIVLGLIDLISNPRFDYTIRNSVNNFTLIKVTNTCNQTICVA